MKKVCLSVLGAIVGLAFTSCSNHPDMEEMAQKEMTVTYEEAFTKKFGQPASDQDWGFDVYGVPETKASTRKSDKQGDPSKWDFSCRIIGEDLTVDENSDFDFNDVVFDVVVEGQKNTQLILQAAGGIYPIYIKHGNEIYEIHEQFGVETSQMVNTGEGSVEKDPVTIQTNWNIPNPNAVHEIQVYVVKNGIKSVLDASKGVPAAKICVPITFEWCDERVPIETQYPRFTKWVKDKDYIWF